LILTLILRFFKEKDRDMGFDAGFILGAAEREDDSAKRRKRCRVRI